MKACVVGATGETGRRIVNTLVDRQIPVRALVRDQEQARSILPSEAELMVGDLSPGSLRQAMEGCTVVLSGLGARPSVDPTGPYAVDYEGIKTLTDVAQERGIEQLVMVSSLCVSQFFHPLNLFWLILMWKKRAEEYLQNSGLTYTIVRPGGLLNEDNDDTLVMAAADTLFEGRIPRTKVAEVCVEALFQPLARNKIVEIVAKPDMPELSMEKMFASVN